MACMFPMQKASHRAHQAIAAELCNLLRYFLCNFLPLLLQGLGLGSMLLKELFFFLTDVEPGVGWKLFNWFSAKHLLFMQAT